MGDSEAFKLVVGDVCFAHVKSYPWWPARIVSIGVKNPKKVNLKIFSVVFFGTNETANLPAKELVPVSPSTILQYVNKASMKRKYFKEAFEAMQESITLEHDQAENEVESKVTSRLTKKDFLLTLKLRENRVLQEHSNNIVLKVLPNPHSNLYGSTSASKKALVQAPLPGSWIGQDMLLPQDKTSTLSKVTSTQIEEPIRNCDLARVHIDENLLLTPTDQLHSSTSSSISSDDKILFKSQTELNLPNSNVSIFNQKAKKVPQLSHSSTKQALVDPPSIIPRSSAEQLLPKSQLKKPLTPDLNISNVTQDAHTSPPGSSKEALEQAHVSNPSETQEVPLEDTNWDLSEFESQNESLSVMKLNCSFCSKSYRTEVGLVKHCMAKHKEDDDDNDDDNAVLIDGPKSSNKRKAEDSAEPDLVEAKAVSSKTKVLKQPVRSKQKGKTQTSQSKLMKSLRENEIEENKIFHENIVVKENFFFCKICNRFSSTTKMKAKSHVLSCSKNKKQGRPGKLAKCLECDDTFSSKTDLEKHHRQEHLCQLYSCTICLKKFNRRQSYLRHLQAHREPPKLKCPIGLCEKVFRYNCDLSRHMKTHNKPPVNFTKFKAATNEWIDFEVDLEEKRSGSSFSGELVVRELPRQDRKCCRSFTSFQSSLSVANIEDWNALVQLSNTLKLPLDEDAPSSAQTCIFTNKHGETMVKFAWNDFLCAEDMVAEIVLSICSEAVEFSSLNDPRTTDDELLEIVDIAIRNAETVIENAKEPESSAADPLRALLMPRLGLCEVEVQKDDVLGVDDWTSSVDNGLVDDVEAATEKRSVEGKADDVFAVGEVGVAVDLTEEITDRPVEKESRKGLRCPHCGAPGILGTAKLLLHIDRMHSRPYTCTICQVEFADRYFYNLHSTTCFYFCPVDGCIFKEKRESRMAGHLRRHQSDGVAFLTNN